MGRTTIRVASARWKELAGRIGCAEGRTNRGRQQFDRAAIAEGLCVLIRAGCTVRPYRCRPSRPLSSPCCSTRHGRHGGSALFRLGSLGRLTQRRLLQISGAAGLTVVTPVRLSGPADAALAPPTHRTAEKLPGVVTAVGSSTGLAILVQSKPIQSQMPERTPRWYGRAHDCATHQPEPVWLQHTLNIAMPVVGFGKPSRPWLSNMLEPTTPLE